MPELIFPLYSKNRQLMRVEARSDRYNSEELFRLRSHVKIDVGDFSSQRVLSSPESFPSLLDDLLRRNPFLISALSHEHERNPDAINAVIIPSLDLILADSPFFGKQAIIVQLSCTRSAIRELFYSYSTPGYGVFSFHNSIPESVSAIYETPEKNSSTLVFGSQEPNARNFISADIQGSLATSYISNPNYVRSSEDAGNQPAQSIPRYIPGPPSLRILLEMPLEQFRTFPLPRFLRRS